MGVTRLKRKDLRNKSKANNRVSRIKQLTATPVIKNVDVEAIKAGFKKSDNKKEDDKKVTAKAEKAASSEKESAPKTEKKEKAEKKEDSSEKE